MDAAPAAAMEGRFAGKKTLLPAMEGGETAAAGGRSSPMDGASKAQKYGATLGPRRHDAGGGRGRLAVPTRYAGLVVLYSSESREEVGRDDVSDFVEYLLWGRIPLELALFYEASLYLLELLPLPHDLSCCTFVHGWWHIWPFRVKWSFLQPFGPARPEWRSSGLCQYPQNVVCLFFWQLPPPCRPSNVPQPSLSLLCGFAIRPKMWWLVAWRCTGVDVGG